MRITQTKLQIITALIIFTVSAVLYCTAHKATHPFVEQKNDILLYEFDKEGFIDSNTFRVIIIVPAKEQYDETTIARKGQERALVSLKNYVLSQQKGYNAKMQDHLIKTITTYGILQKRDSLSATRFCYYYDIKKIGLKSEIDALGK